MAKTAGKKTESTESKTKKTTAPKADHTQREASAVKTSAPKAKKVAKRAAADKGPKIGRVSGRVCKMKACKREYKAKGYCVAHYKKWRQGEYGKTRYKACKDVSCFKPMALNRHGFCEDHYQNYFVKGIEQAKAPAAAKPAAKEAAPAAAEAS